MISLMTARPGWRRRSCRHLGRRAIGRSARNAICAGMLGQKLENELRQASQQHRQQRRLGHLIAHRLLVEEADAAQRWRTGCMDLTQQLVCRVAFLPAKPLASSWFCRVLHPICSCRRRSVTPDLSRASRHEVR
jgi:hypothetical protein